MNLVTIIDYDDNSSKNLLCCLWMFFAQKWMKKDDKIFVLTSGKISNYILNNFKQYDNIEIIIRKCWQPDKPINSRGMDFTNIFKLYNLCFLKFPYIFIDVDAIILADPHYLWELRKDKPWIIVDHQTPPGYEQWNFMNTGVVIVDDPTFCNWNKIIELQRQRDFVYDIGGYDQPLLDVYFKDIKYDYHHEKFGHDWNSCADFNRIWMTPKCEWKAETFAFDKNYPVNIHHYWNKKPWNSDWCPLYNYYNKLFYSVK